IRLPFLPSSRSPTQPRHLMFSLPAGRGLLATISAPVGPGRQGPGDLRASCHPVRRHPALVMASGKTTNSTSANLSPAFLDASDGQGRLDDGFCERARWSFKRGLHGEAILQASVPELIEGPDGAQDVALAGIVKEPQQAGRGVPAHG